MSERSLPGGWRRVSLGELLTEAADLTYGVVQPGPPTADGIPIVRVKDIRGGRVAVDDPLLISPNIERQYQRSRIRGGELLVTLVGTVGETAVAPDELRGWNTARAVATVRLPTADDSRWVGYCLQTPEGKDRIGSRVNTTVQTTLNLKDLREFPVTLPPIAERGAIAGVLGALDDKIESNRRIASTAQELGDAIFSSRSDATRPLGEVAGVTMGSSPPGSTYNGEARGLPFYQGVADFDFRFPRLRVYCDGPVRTAEPGDALVSVRAPVGRLNRARERCCIGRGLAAVHSGTPRTLFYALRAAGDVWAPYNAEGTVFGAIKAADIQTVRVPWPTDAALAECEQDLTVVDDRLSVALRESVALTSVRDALLPELLSGRLRVRDAEEMVGSV